MLRLRSRLPRGGARCWIQKPALLKKKDNTRGTLLRHPDLLSILDRIHTEGKAWLVYKVSTRHDGNILNFFPRKGVSVLLVAKSCLGLFCVHARSIK